ncbi:NCAPG2 [Cervus elaphus hippelaphus]|uniref:NCAPG2 n=1 Tax=Cervus elaphus hippelaphus TaxID=46360 RepID=A0A212CK74_CEREH|nr:NCAPG2 [Cervus elaphus hippelaphus]
MPPTILIDLLKKVTEELAFDLSSADVRCSVFKCLPIILDNKLSHPLLEQLLPALKYCLHDNSEKVRVAFVDMLLKVKAVRAAKVGAHAHRRHRQGPCCQRAVLAAAYSEGILPSRPVSPGGLARRARQRLWAQTRKGENFVEETHVIVLHVLAKLIHVIRHCLNACIQRALTACREDAEEPGKENTSALDQTLSVSDAASMAGLLEIVVILWRSIHRSLENNKEARVYTVDKFASVLPQYMRMFTDDRCRTPLCVLASLMPAPAVPVFSCGVVSTLRNQEEGAADRTYCILLDCLCSWGHVGHILELVCDWLPEEPPQSKGNSASRRKVRVQDPCPVKPGLALVYVEYLLTHPKNRECLLSAPQKKLNCLLKALEASKPRLLLPGSVMPEAPTRQQRAGRSGVGGMRRQSSVRGSRAPGAAPVRSCLLAALREAWQREAARASQDAPRRCACPALRAAVSSPPGRAAGSEPGLRSPVRQGDLESILQLSDGSPPRLSEGAALRAFSLHCRLSVHLQHKFCSDGKLYLSTLEDTGSWLESKVLSFIRDQDEEYLKLHRVAYQQIIQTYLTVCKDVIMVGLGDRKFQTRLLQWSLGIMQTVKGFFYVSLLLGILKEITGSSLTRKTDSEEEVAAVFDLVQKVFQRMLECMARSFKKQPEEGLQLLYSVQTPLHEFIGTVQCWHVDTPVHHGVFSTLIAASVVEISHELRKVSDVEELTPPEGLSAFPPFSRCLIGIIIKSPNVVRSFLDELKACVISEDIEGIVCLTAVLHIILVINKGKHKSLNVKDVAAAVDRRLKAFMEITLEEDSLER